ncbi:GNAT family N-acetyltransferase [Salegentibacter chungangensis]|uniref:GNAT family N-acetyltransferase n=1 Tax=Salegentibacter chungangensis TaxID=1335724 RepID=A0ABW3NV54_9FLAO
MLTLKGEKIYLRALEPEDLDFVHCIENKEDLWEVSAAQTPYSRHLIRQYLRNSHRDVYEMKQLRLVICNLEGAQVGLIDIYDFDPKSRRAALGIIIAETSDRKKGYGAESLGLICKYCFNHLDLHQVYANIGEDNLASRRLFEKQGFENTGIKKDWNLVNGSFKDELLYQLINNVH